MPQRNDLANKVITFPCSRVKLSNRFVKAAMYEHMSYILGGPPNSYHCALYSKWASFEWAMIITGNVQVDARHLTLGRDMVVPRTLTEETIAPFEKLSASMGKKLSIMQLSHAGRQSSNLIGGRLPFAAPLAPSAVRVTGKSEGILSATFHALLFQTPQSMSHYEIDSVVNDFLRGANLAYKAGFNGVQLHVAHGYLLSQFLSAKTNLRTDEYSCRTPEGALRVLQRIVIGVRANAPKSFILGVKFSTENTTEDQEIRALEYIRLIASWGLVDFTEISGGDYTDPAFMDIMPPASARQAMFASFSEKVSIMLSSTKSKTPVPLVMLTGGLRSPALCHSALANKQAQLLGFGRGAILCPNVPGAYRSRNEEPEHDTAPFGEEPDNTGFGNRILKLVPHISLVGAGTSMAWYLVMLRRMAEPQEASEILPPSYGVDALLRMWLWLGAPEMTFTVFICAGWILGLLLATITTFVF